MLTTTYAEPLKQELLDQAAKDDKAHPWRVCPLGQHFVRTHLEHIPPSKTNPQGKVITRHEHCAHNPSHKDMLSLDEIVSIYRFDLTART